MANHNNFSPEDGDSCNINENLYPSKEESVNPGTHSIDIQSRHFSMTPSLKTHIESKCSKLASANSHIRSVNFVITKENQLFVSSINVVIEGYADLHVSKNNEDSYNCIDECIDVAINSLRKLNKKIIKECHHINKMQEVDADYNELAYDDMEYMHDEFMTKKVLHVADYTKKSHPIVSRKLAKVKTLTQEEAIMHVSTSIEPVIMYVGEEDQKCKLMYRQEDGALGILEFQGLNVTFNYNS